MDINIAFCRKLLLQAYKELTPEQKSHYRQHAWVWADGMGHYEFHMKLDPLHKDGGEMYWYGDADNAYDARYHGLCEFLAKYGNAEQKKAYE